METQTAILEFLSTVPKITNESGELIQEQIRFYQQNHCPLLTTKAVANKQYTPAPNNAPNKPKIPWTTAKHYNNWLSDSKRIWFYIAKKLFQMRTKRLKTINKCWIGE